MSDNLDNLWSCYLEAKKDLEDYQKWAEENNTHIELMGPGPYGLCVAFSTQLRHHYYKQYAKEQFDKLPLELSEEEKKIAYPLFAAKFQAEIDKRIKE